MSTMTGKLAGDSIVTRRASFFWCCAILPAPKRQSPIQPWATPRESPATAIDRTDRSDQSDRSDRMRWLAHLSAPSGQVLRAQQITCASGW